MKKSILLFVMVILSFAALQAQDMVFPAIQGYGGVIPVPFAAEKPDPSQKYKFVIELGKKVEDKTQLADMLDYAARLYNLHRYAGVPKENIEMGVVIYASSTPMVMSDSAYRKRFNKNNNDSARVNPNGPLLEELHRNGIQVIICGQSMMKQDLLPGDIYPGVRLAVSRFTATTDFLVKGYQLIVL